MQVVVAWPFPGRQISTPAQLFVLCLAVLLPVMAFAGFLTWRFSEAERGMAYGKALDNVRQINSALDRDLNGRISALRVLALSSAIGNADFVAFQGQAQRAKVILGSDIALKSLSGNVLADSARPSAAPQRGDLSVWESLALEADRPVISDLVEEGEEARPVLTVSVPVHTVEGTAGVLTMTIDAAGMADVFGTAIPDAWTGSVIDGAGRIITRSRDADRFVGAEATDDLREHATAREGTWLGTTLDGTRVLSAYATSDLSSWRVAVGVPVWLVERPISQSLFWLLVLGGVGLLVSGAVAVFFGGAISGALTQLARQAAAPERADEEPAPATTPAGSQHGQCCACQRGWQSEAPGDAAR